YGAWGSFEEVSRRNEVTLRELLEQAAAGDLLGDYFASGLDVAAVEAAGIAPIAPLLRAIQEQGLRALPELHRAGLFPPLGWFVTADFDDPSANLLWLVQAGLGLPDRETYFEEGAAELRAAYVEHVAAQLANVGLDAGAARSVLELETRLA